MGKSVLGPGIKAGSPNYVSQFMAFKETGYPMIGAIEKDHPLLRLARNWESRLDWGEFADAAEDLYKTVRAVKSYLYRFEQEFSKGKDYFHLRGQDNILRFLPIGKVVVRIHEDDNLFEVLARIAAARICKCRVRISIPAGLKNEETEFIQSRECKPLVGGANVSFQSDAELIELIPDIHRIRYAAPDRVPDAVFQAAAQTGFYIAREPVLMEGRIELLHYLRNQSICDMYHRYGNLGERTPGMSSGN
jgi:RHH-type proline utilization regulon transcriptional repressor/proline dehydrogenase/delta 1-pyrroline-5-carboxylate dehydrogenase